MVSLPITLEYRIQGMTCMNCAERIERTLRKQPGVLTAQVRYPAGQAAVLYDPDQIQPRTLIAAIEKLGYHVVVGGSATGRTWGDLGKTAAILAGLGAIYLVLKLIGLDTWINNFPLAEQGMGYGLIFLIGILTSVHCVAMCGAINLSACSMGPAAPAKFASAPAAAASAHSSDEPADGRAAIGPSFLYNLGRVIAYTVIGALVGGLGSVISFTGALRGVVIALAGLFMILMGINLLGLFPRLARFVPHLPKTLGRQLNKARQKTGNRPLVIGLLNGLMPCGPLQAMQLYALSTGSPVSGAIAMFLFAVGTVPLMFTLGAVSTLLTQKFSRTMIRVSSMLVVTLGLVMLQNGLSLAGVQLPSQRPVVAAASQPATAADPGAPASAAENIGDVQVIRTKLQPNAYEPITVQVGKSVRWIMTADKASLNGCNRELYIPEYDLTKQLELGENIIEFTPTKTGVYPFSCWMGMINSQITVVD